MDSDDDCCMPDLGAYCLDNGGRGAIFTFSRLDLTLIDWASEGAYTCAATLGIEATYRSYALAIDVDAATFARLVALAPYDIRSELEEMSAEPFSCPYIVDIDPGSLVVGVRARLGEPRRTCGGTYVPFVVLEFFPARAAMVVVVGGGS